MKLIPKKLRNAGESYGLEYPYIYRSVHLVWHRDTGKIVNMECSGNPFTDQAAGQRKCRELNGLPEEHDMAVNVLHDLET